MQRKLVLEFTKMNGAGNDFVVVDNRFYHFSDEELSELAKRLCRRRFGVGADGLLALSVPRESGSHFRMRYLNADGSIGTMCGNGARCLVRFARQAGIVADEMYFETDAGVLRALVSADASHPVRLFLGPPRDFQPERLIDGQAGPLHYIWTGTEHAVCFVDRVSETPVGEWGPAIRNDEALRPAGANVNFVEVEEDGEPGRAVLRARTFEKGVEAETLACGTGAVASAIVARLLGRVHSETVDVVMPGGTLTVGFGVDGSSVRDVFLEGPAEMVYRGSLEV